MKRPLRLAAGALCALGLVLAQSSPALARGDASAVSDRHDPTGLYVGLGAGLSAYVVAPAVGAGTMGNLHLGYRVSEMLGLQVSLGGLWLFGFGLPGGALGNELTGTVRLFARTSGRWDPYLEVGGIYVGARSRDPVITYRALGFLGGVGHEVHISNWTLGMHARYLGLMDVKSSDPEASPPPKHGSIVDGEFYVAVRF